ncbi:ATP-binding protein, partial [Pseudomonas savastanoi]
RLCSIAGRSGWGQVEAISIAGRYNYAPADEQSLAD